MYTRMLIPLDVPVLTVSSPLQALLTRASLRNSQPLSALRRIEPQGSKIDGAAVRQASERGLGLACRQCR